MGMEGGKRFEQRPVVSRGTEGRRDVSPRRTPEVMGETSWIERYMTPERLAEVAASSYGANRSPESLLLERLQTVIIETGPELAPHVKKSLRAFISAFRIAAYPNMRPHEQDLIRDIAESHPGGWAEEIIDSDQVGADIRVAWRRFGFRVPDVEPGEIGSEFARFYPQPALEAEKVPQEGGEGLEIPSVVVPSVQVVLLREGKNGTEVFLGKRKAGGFLNQWSFLGGRMDEGEYHEQTGRRELREEAGVDVPEDRFTFLRDTQSSTVREKDGKRVRYDYQMRVFVVDAQGLAPYNASPDEHSEMRWMSLEKALGMHARALAAATSVGESIE